MSESKHTPGLPRHVVRDIFLAAGFTIKPGQTDLKPYVYAAADALIVNACRDLAAEVERLREERDEAVTALPQAIRAERRKVEALRTLWPVIEHAMAGLVFTGDKAGEVAAQMNAARVALASTEGGAK